VITRCDTVGTGHLSETGGDGDQLKLSRKNDKETSPRSRKLRAATRGSSSVRDQKLTFRLRLNGNPPEIESVHSLVLGFFERKGGEKLSDRPVLCDASGVSDVIWL
jgi:hypothetical protein